MPVQNVSANDLFPSKWIKSDDIPEGKNLIVTVNDATFEPIGSDKQMKYCLHFAEGKGLVVNKTNFVTLQTLFGGDLNAPIGKRIALFAQPVSFAGKTTMGVRVNPKLPQPAAPKPAPRTEREIVQELGYDDEEPAVAEPEFDEVM